jgi:hypothetical protein
VTSGGIGSALRGGEMMVAAPDVIHGSLGERHTALGATALVLRNGAVVIVFH